MSNFRLPQSKIQKIFYQKKIVAFKNCRGGALGPPPHPPPQIGIKREYFQVGVAIYGRYATLNSPPVSYLAHISGSVAGVTIGEQPFMV